MLYSHIQLYVYIYNYIQKHSQHNIRTSMNERTNFFIKIYLSHIILERVAKGLRKAWCWLCVRGELETGTDCNILTQSSSRNHSSTSPSSWLGCSNVVHWGSRALCLEMNSNRLEAVCCSWLYNYLKPTCFLWA